MKPNDNAQKLINLKDTASYQVGNTKAVVNCIFKENSESLNAIIERLIKSEVSK